MIELIDKQTGHTLALFPSKDIADAKEEMNEYYSKFLPFKRIYHKKDLVTKLPPWWMFYIHVNSGIAVMQGKTVLPLEEVFKLEEV